MTNLFFVRVGKFAVSEVHVASVQFNDDGSAVVHTMSNSMSTSDPDEVRLLHEFVGDQPKQSAAPDDPPVPVADPPVVDQPAPGLGSVGIGISGSTGNGPQLVKEPAASTEDEDPTLA